jgi:shikimate 5-dehydrogenase
MLINKNTKIYGSFSLNDGNNGNIFFNKYFELYNIDAIYKSFSVNNIKDAVSSAKILNFSGFAVSMPFKKDILNYVDNISDEVNIIKSANTIINKNNKLIAYNTDYIGIKEIIKNYKEIIILGNGGLSWAAQYACKTLNISYEIIERKNWNYIEKLKNKIILNCTPVENIKIDKSNIFLDAIPTTPIGKKIHTTLAKEQFFLYTGIKINQII